ncbi:MAG: hypothetical protein KDC18_04865 [Alphaproteobacteria bacterium]|nr:hypothetical protein [Alphaproteobacteria bacterium]MCB9929547.1 hypothetical protein [Alphaproteobacteria bacterium]
MTSRLPKISRGLVLASILALPLAAGAVPMPATVGTGVYIPPTTDQDTLFLATYELALTTARPVTGAAGSYRYETSCDYAGTHWRIENCEVVLNGALGETMTLNGTFVHQTAPHGVEIPGNSVSFGNVWNAADVAALSGRTQSNFQRQVVPHRVGPHSDLFLTRYTAKAYPDLGGALPVYRFQSLKIGFQGKHAVPVAGSLYGMAGGVAVLLIGQRRRKYAA